MVRNKRMISLETVYVHEIFKTNGDVMLGWETVKKHLSVKDVKELFENGKINMVNIKGADYGYELFMATFVNNNRKKYQRIEVRSFDKSTTKHRKIVAEFYLMDGMYRKDAIQYAMEKLSDENIKLNDISFMFYEYCGEDTGNHIYKNNC